MLSMAVLAHGYRTSGGSLGGGVRPSELCPHPPPCRNMSRLNGSARIVNNAMDDDGTLIHPGSEGMVSSIRLEAITDGIED